MVHHSTHRYLTLLLTALILTACAQPETSAERHARQYAYAADDGSDPNFYTNKTDTARMMVPFFRQFHDAGAKDSRDGVSRGDALQRADRFRSEEFLKSIQSRETFAGRTYNDSSTLSAKILRAMGEAIAETYLDGYEGRP